MIRNRKKSGKYRFGRTIGIVNCCIGIYTKIYEQGQVIFNDKY